MKTLIPPFAMLSMLLLSNCRQAQTQSSFVAPDQAHWVSLQNVSPGPDDGSLLPTQSLRLENRWTEKGPWLLQGIPSLCSTQVIWDSPSQLRLRMPESRARFLKVKDGVQWDGISVKIELHREDLLFDALSPDQNLRLVVVKQCESEAWNLYLRKVDEALYNTNMDLGWDDPSVYGGFEWNQPPLTLRWTGPRQAEIQVAGKNHDVTLRNEIDGVKVKWIFNRHYRAPEIKSAPLKRAELP